MQQEPMSQQQLDQAEQLLAELEQLETQLGQLREGLAQSHRLATLGTMASVIAHEFNNILTPVISYCQLALGDAADEKLRQKALIRALEGSQKAAEICSSMLGFARDDDGPNITQLSQAIDDVFTCLARDPKRDGIDVRINVDPSIHLAITPVAIQQVLLNLVLNARQAMHRNGGILAVSASTIEGDASCVRITVADTGPGIPPDLLPDIFKPFVTRRDNAASIEKGTGLGLAICHDLIKRAGGAITVESSDAGAIFTIELPQADVNSAHPTDAARLAG